MNTLYIFVGTEYASYSKQVMPVDASDIHIFYFLSEEPELPAELDKKGASVKLTDEHGNLIEMLIYAVDDISKFEEYDAAGECADTAISLFLDNEHSYTNAMINELRNTIHAEVLKIIENNRKAERIFSVSVV